ncbi:MAG TPA: hypothetical protein VNY10_21580 [Roseiarcus sp.]|nr:hypothetical protein [Roseiarcus sp.]
MAATGPATAAVIAPAGVVIGADTAAAIAVVAAIEEAAVTTAAERIPGGCTEWRVSLIVAPSARPL